MKKIKIFGDCSRFRVPLWQCPTFLFVLMGFVVIAAILTSYFFSKVYSIEPEYQALLALFVAMVTFTFGHFVVMSFEKVAEANMLKSQFLNVLSHQLLTPLSSLKWSLSLLDSKVAISEDEKKELFSIIDKSGERMINMVNTLLDISRLDVGKVKMKFEKVDIGEVVKGIAESKKQEFDMKKNTLTLKIADDLPFVKADKQRIAVVVDNLISNAFKFSLPEKDIIIRLYVEKGKVVFSVEDFGVGIPHEERRHILFSKFFKSSNIMKYQTKGFGLGLFTAKFIVEASGGGIDFESKEGVGSKFWFSLPIYKD
jgi:signal transduction histidine kinase